MKQEFLHRAANTLLMDLERVNKKPLSELFAIVETPFHPMGFGQHGESKYFLTGKHLGKRVEFDSLPDQVKTFILRNI